MEASNLGLNSIYPGKRHCIQGTLLADYEGNTCPGTIIRAGICTKQTIPAYKSIFYKSYMLMLATEQQKRVISLE